MWEVHSVIFGKWFHTERTPLSVHGQHTKLEYRRSAEERSARKRSPRWPGLQRSAHRTKLTTRLITSNYITTGTHSAHSQLTALPRCRWVFNVTTDSDGAFGNFLASRQLARFVIFSSTVTLTIVHLFSLTSVQE